MKMKAVVLVLFLSILQMKCSPESSKQVEGGKNSENGNNLKLKPMNFDKTLLSADEKMDGIIEPNPFNDKNQSQVSIDEIFLSDILSSLNHRTVDIEA